MQHRLLRISSVTTFLIALKKVQNVNVINSRWCQCAGFLKKITVGHNAFSGSSTSPVESQRLLPTSTNIDIRSQLAILSTAYGCAGKVTAAKTIYDQILRGRKHNNECINYFKLFLRCNLRNQIKNKRGNSESGLLQKCSIFRQK